MLSPNRALKKIIQDLIAEGGVGLYTVDSAAGKAGGSVPGPGQALPRPCEGRERGVDENGANACPVDWVPKLPQAVPAKVRVVDVFREHVLSLKCMGPPEVTDWFQRSFNVTPRGCMGGRNNYGRNLNHKNGQGVHDIHANALNPNAHPSSSSSSSSADAVSSSGADGAAKGVFLAEDMLVFKDNNISRQHFEVSLVRPGVYAIRDLGSVGGTYLRVPFATNTAEMEVPVALATSQSMATDAKVGRADKEQNAGCGHAAFPAVLGGVQGSLQPDASNGSCERVGGTELVYLDSLQMQQTGDSSGNMQVLRCGQRLRPFTMFLLGKHQFLVEKIDDRNTPAGNKIYTKGAAAGTSSGDKQIALVVAEAEAVLAQIRQLSLGEEEESEENGSGSSSSSSSSSKKVAAAPGAGADRDTLIKLQRRLDALTEQLDGWDADTTSDAAAEAKHGSSGKAGARYILPTKLKNRRCVVTCVGPDGSPSVGKSYVVGAGGAVIGRNIPSTAVTWQNRDCNQAAQSAYMDAKHADSPRKPSGASSAGAALSEAVPLPTSISVVDNALSSEHARIILDPISGHFHLCDGAFRVTAQAALSASATSAINILVKYEPSKSSTNGSWVRLSAASKMSPWFVIRAGMEVSISQVRFVISQGEDTVYERDVLED